MHGGLRHASATVERTGGRISARHRQFARKNCYLLVSLKIELAVLHGEVLMNLSIARSWKSLGPEFLGKYPHAWQFAGHFTFCFGFSRLLEYLHAGIGSDGALALCLLSASAAFYLMHGRSQRPAAPALPARRSLFGILALGLFCVSAGAGVAYFLLAGKTAYEIRFGPDPVTQIDRQYSLFAKLSPEEKIVLYRYIVDVSRGKVDGRDTRSLTGRTVRDVMVDAEKWDRERTAMPDRNRT
jgi:hypothetical protein